MKQCGMPEMKMYVFVLVKIKVFFFKISQNSQENTCARVSFNKVAGLRLATLLKRDTGTGFSCECFEIFKNIFFIEHLLETASDFFYHL